MVRPLAVALLAALAASPALGQGSYPNKPIRWIIPYAAGGGTDVIARPLATKLGEVLGQPILYDNRGGAGGLQAAEAVAKSPGDGYTFLISSNNTHTFPTLLYETVPFDPVKDFAAITHIASVPNILVVNPAFPAKSLQELVAHAKASPGKINWASSGNGGSTHLALVLVAQQAGVRVTHVPYKGENPGVADLLAGQIPYMFSNFPVVYPHVQARKIRAVAITSPQRSQLAPEIPTVAESGIPGFDTATWSGLYAPPGTARDAVQRIAGDVLKIKSGAEFKKRMLQQGIDMSDADTPERHAAFLKVEFARWGKVAQEAGVKVE